MYTLTPLCAKLFAYETRKKKTGNLSSLNSSKHIRLNGVHRWLKTGKCKQERYTQKPAHNELCLCFSFSFCYIQQCCHMVFAVFSVIFFFIIKNLNKPLVSFALMWLFGCLFFAVLLWWPFCQLILYRLMSLLRIYVFISRKPFMSKNSIPTMKFVQYLCTTLFFLCKLYFCAAVVFEFFVACNCKKKKN